MASATSDRRRGLTGDKGMKAPVDLATTASITLAGEQSIDGVLTASSRVLVKNQADTTQNGMYDSSSGAWTRSIDANGNQDLVKGTLVAVTGGSQSGQIFQCAAANPVTIGSSPITFVASLTTVQNPGQIDFNETISYPVGTLGDTYAGYAFPSAKPYLADRTGVVDAAAAFISCISNNLVTVVLPGTYLLASLVTIASTGSNRKIYFMPGVTLISSQPAGAAQGMFYFAGTGEKFRIIGNGVKLQYTSPPTVRTAHVVYVRGTSIIDLDISGLEIINGANMGIAVFCGDDNTVASGSQGIHVHDCRIRDTLGDGVHVEGADGDVRIERITGYSNGDDVVAVINYTGPGTAPTHPTTTKGVQIRGIRGFDVRTSTVSIAGIDGFVIDDIQEEANVAYAVLTIKAVHAAGYTVGNQNGVIDNVVSSGATKILALDTPVGGTAFNRYMQIGKIAGSNILNQAISLSNGSAAAGGALQAIHIESLDLRGSGAAGSQIGYIANTMNCRIGDLRADTFAAGLQAAANIDFSWASMKMQAFAVGTTFALSITGDTNLRCGALEINAGNCAIGVQCQSNTGVKHDGLWAVSNGTANYAFGSNSAVRGFFDYIAEVKAIGAVTNGTTLVITYPRVVPAGAAFLPSIDVLSDDGLRWGVKNAGNTTMTMVWTDSQSNVFVSYQLALQAA